MKLFFSKLTWVWLSVVFLSSCAEKAAKKEKKGRLGAQPSLQELRQPDQELRQPENISANEPVVMEEADSMQKSSEAKVDDAITPSRTNDINCSDEKVYSWAKNYCVSSEGIPETKVPTFSGEVLNFSHPDFNPSFTDRMAWVGDWQFIDGSLRAVWISVEIWRQFYIGAIDQYGGGLGYYTAGNFTKDGSVELLTQCGYIEATNLTNHTNIENNAISPSSPEPDGIPNMDSVSTTNRYVNLRFPGLCLISYKNNSTVDLKVLNDNKVGDYSELAKKAHDAIPSRHQEYDMKNYPYEFDFSMQGFAQNDRDSFTAYSSANNKASIFHVSEEDKVVEDVWDLNPYLSSRDWTKTWFGNFDAKGPGQLALSSGNNAYMSLNNNYSSFSLLNWQLVESSLFSSDKSVIDIDNPSYTWAVDFNGNGRTDLISVKGTLPSAGSTIKVFANIGNKDSATLKPMFDYQTCDGGAWGRSEYVFVGNFAGHEDGRLDIVSFEGNIAYFKLNDGAGCFIPFTMNLSLSAWGSAAKSFRGDFNGDGREDILTFHSDNKFIVHLSKVETDHSIKFKSIEFNLPPQISVDKIRELFMANRSDMETNPLLYRDPNLNSFGKTVSADFLGGGLDAIITLDKEAVYVLKPHIPQ